MPRRLQFGSVSGDTLDTLDAQIGTGNENGNNPDNDLVIRDSSGTIVLRYDESAGAWVPEVFAFEDSTADPSANGELQRNGADLKAYSGGAVRNLSNIGASSGSPGGMDTHVQYNDGGSFGGDSNLTWDDATTLLTVEGETDTNDLTVSNAVQATLPMNGNDVDGAGTVDFDNTTESQATASEGTSYNVDLSTSNYHKVTLTGDVTFDFTNVDATDVNSFVLHIVQDATGSRTPSFTPTVVWDSGTAPSWSTAANAEDIVTFIHDQDGSQWIGLLGGLGLA